MSEAALILLGIGFAVLTCTVGDVLIAQGMQKVGAIEWHGLRAIPGQIKTVLTTPQIPIAVIFMTLFFFTWLALLSRADLSLILPLMALTYVLNGVAAGPCLGEHVSRQRWAGIWVIALGVFVVSLTS